MYLLKGTIYEDPNLIVNRKIDLNKNVPKNDFYFVIIIVLLLVLCYGIYKRSNSGHK